MGKKDSAKATGASKAPASAIPVWKKSTVTEAYLEQLEREEVIMQRAMILYRAADGKEIPSPDTHWAVIFVDFFKCGFQLPPSAFFNEVLVFCGVELMHLNPNSIVMLTVFAHLCEAYLFIRSNLDLFRYYYHMNRMQCNTVVGDAGLRLRDGGKKRYLEFSSKFSWSGWHSKWFYYQPPVPGGINYHGLAPYRTDAWSETSRLTVKIKTYALEIQDLKEQGLTAWDVAKDFITRRISPLHSWVPGAWVHSAEMDPTREELSPQTVQSRTKFLFETLPKRGNATIPRPIIEMEPEVATELSSVSNHMLSYMGTVVYRYDHRIRILS